MAARETTTLVPLTPNNWNLYRSEQKMKRLDRNLQNAARATHENQASVQRTVGRINADAASAAKAAVRASEGLDRKRRDRPNSTSLPWQQRVLGRTTDKLAVASGMAHVAEGLQSLTPSDPTVHPRVLSDLRSLTPHSQREEVRRIAEMLGVVNGAPLAAKRPAQAP